MTLRILIAVTHLLGAGHLVRASAIARVLARRGHEVVVASGGVPFPLADLSGASLLQLPPVRCRPDDLATLLGEDGRPVGGAHLADRCRALLSAFVRLRPDVVLTEHFPFGRRSLAGEFQALLDAVEAARPRPVLLASVRDILVAPAKPEKIERTHALIARRFAGVLVHGDPSAVPLERSWPVDASLATRLIYTGYVGGRAEDDVESDARDAAPDDILVSGGSSSAALPLYHAAIAAAARQPRRSWRVLVGPGVSDDAFHALVGCAPPNARVERARPDFVDLLRRAAIFVGQAGYNTVMDIVATHARAVLVPFEQGNETEQRLRADALAAAGQAVLLPQSELSPDRLLDAVTRAGSMPKPRFITATDGHERAADAIERLARESRAAGSSDGDQQ